MDYFFDLDASHHSWGSTDRNEHIEQNVDDDILTSTPGLVEFGGTTPQLTNDRELTGLYHDVDTQNEPTNDPFADLEGHINPCPTFFSEALSVTEGNYRPDGTPSLTSGSTGGTGTDMLPWPSHAHDATDLRVSTDGHESMGDTSCLHGDVLTSLTMKSGMVESRTTDRTVDVEVIRLFTRERSDFRPDEPWACVMPTLTDPRFTRQGDDIATDAPIPPGTNQIPPGSGISPAPDTPQPTQQNDGRAINLPGPSSDVPISPDTHRMPSSSGPSPALVAPGPIQHSGGRAFGLFGRSGNTPIPHGTHRMPPRSGHLPVPIARRPTKPSEGIAIGLSGSYGNVSMPFGPQDCTGGPICEQCKEVKSSRFFHLPCSTPRLSELLKIIFPGKLINWIERRKRNRAEEAQAGEQEQGANGEGEAGDGQQLENCLIQLKAGTGPSFTLQAVRVKSKPAYPHMLQRSGELQQYPSAHTPQTSAIYLRDGPEELTAKWNEWLDIVTTKDLRQSCKQAFCRADDWVLEALDIVCDFCVAVSAGAVSRTPAATMMKDQENKSNMMLNCSVKLFFAIYLMCTPLEVNGEGLDKDERHEISKQFRSVAQKIVERLIRHISEQLHDLICARNDTFVGHVMSTLLFLSLSNHLNQFIRFCLSDATANDLSARAEIDDMNKDVYYVSELVYATFGTAIKDMIRMRADAQQQPNRRQSNQQQSTAGQVDAWRMGLQQDTSKLICGLSDLIEGVIKKSYGKELCLATSFYDISNENFSPNASRAIFNVLVPLADRGLNPLCKRNESIRF
ncbi:uncharacterized protein GIQ15_03150 [Arthroderma uncinatum]|uniref:uncharacterized protein n=1 Tax=Arthroderma uncinatum TaxID=74035 RepID=UPI00144A7675|nr:uncharacterized protein GIQ15_03150 [Arthroderma uncinatum]KAF3483826.1 hypothetical protein GIQ15_03150 [Arthroderma uncinatum]